LIEDQHRRRTSAARLAYEQHHLKDGGALQSPSLADAHVMLAEKKEPCQDAQERRALSPRRALVWWYALLAFGRIRCWLLARA
jgi:hypothetical protein